MLLGRRGSEIHFHAWVPNPFSCIATMCLFESPKGLNNYNGCTGGGLSWAKSRHKKRVSRGKSPLKEGFATQMGK